MKINENNLVVRQSNALIEASYKIASIGEGRLIRLLIAQIESTDEDFKTYKISVSDFSKLFELSKNSNSVYDLIKKAADDLAGRRIMIEHGKSWIRLNWLSYASYKDGEGCVEVRFDSALKPYLLQLKTHWKQYPLDTIVHFRSSYSIRMYELLKIEEFKVNKYNQFSKTFEYDELRRILGILNHEYVFFKDFRRYIIESSQKEINENSDLKIIQVDYTKTVRKITGIVFHCEKITPKAITQSVPEVSEVEKAEPDYITELISIGIDASVANKWKRLYGVKKIREGIAYTKAMQQAGKIRDNLAGFLATAIRDNIAASWTEEKTKKQEARNEVIKKEATKQLLEDAEKEEQRKEREAIIKEFMSLSDGEKQSIRGAYEKTLNDLVLASWNRAKKANPKSPETSKSAMAGLMNFYRTYRLNLTLPI